MVHLINGRGQLGEQLKRMLKEQPLGEELYIYHTWNVQDKSKKAQEEEYKKFQIFIESHASKKIIFVSTKSQRETWYTHYKQLAEAYTLLYCNDGLIVRIPTIVGKGVIEKFETDQAQPYGEMELITLTKAAQEIIKICSYEGALRSFTIDGDRVSAELVYNLVRRK